MPKLITLVVSKQKSPKEDALGRPYGLGRYDGRTRVDIVHIEDDMDDIREQLRRTAVGGPRYHSPCARHLPVWFWYTTYGHFEGVITLDDVLKAITGVFREDETKETAIVRREDGSYLGAGWVPIDEFADEMGFSLESLTIRPSPDLR